LQDQGITGAGFERYSVSGLTGNISVTSSKQVYVFILELTERLLMVVIIRF
jgi:hypothetical protein